MKLQRILPLIIMFLFIGGAVASDDATRQQQVLHDLRQRAAGGDPKALYDLAVMYDIGYDSIPIDSAMSTALYRLAADKGFAPAMNYLGYRYFNGDYVTQNVDSALFWLAKAAGAGDMKAANNLGFLLSHDDVVTRDYKQAVYWLTKAADAGLPAAQSLLAALLRQGLGAEKDTVAAERLYTAAMQQGLGDAQLKLLSMKGWDWEKLSADSAVSLGRYYYTHNAPIIGVTLFENAAKYDDPEALALLGDAYSRAIGAQYNHDKALEYYLKAALLNQPSAQFVIGELLDIFPDAMSYSVADSLIKVFYLD